MSDNFHKDDLKRAFGSFATGVAVATSHSSGFTINSFASLSLEPPLIIFNIYKTETDHVEFLKTNRFAINILSSDQEETSKLFATKDENKVAKTPHHISEKGNIIIEQIDIADHVLVIGKVETLDTNNEKKPLIYYRSGYKQIT